MIFLRIPHKKITLFTFLILIVLGIVLVINYRSKQTPSPETPQSPTIIPVQDATELNPSYKKNGFIPTYSPEKGSGVDLEAPLVAHSMDEIQKLYPFLPFEEVLITPSNQEVTIIIPDAVSQPNQWTLQVTIFGLDYQLAKDAPEYMSTKESFIYASSFLNTWIEEKGADPKKIMIVWGDKSFIQNKSQEWLE